MLGNVSVHAVVGVKDLAEARIFYEETLGLQKEDDTPAGVLYRSGDTKMFVYETQYGGTNQATAASWDVDDVSAAVAELKGKGVGFEHYDMPDTTLEGDVHVMGPMKAAWFKDPSGNVLCVSNGAM